MISSSFLIRPPHTLEELIDHVQGYVEVGQSFSPDPFPQDTVARQLRSLTTLPGYKPEQVRNVYRDGELVGGCRIYERWLRTTAAQAPTSQRP
jgi:hypothetical protein